MPSSHSCDFSVVVVSDFEAGGNTWKDAIAMAQRLGSEGGHDPFPLIFVESALHRHVPPPDAIQAAFPGARIEYHDSTTSAAMKDHGVSLCTTEWVAVLEADSVPECDWLRSLLDAAAGHPGYDVITGGTTYGKESSWQRALNMLDRSFDDPGRSQATGHISNNGALYRTRVLRNFPYPDADTPFLSSRLRNQQIFQAGHKAYFERRAVTRHAIGGLGFVVDFRRHTGFADMLMDGKPGIGRIPRLIAWRMRNEIGNMLRLHGDYLRWYDWPLVALLFCFARIPEALGMLAALKEGPLTRSAYR